jgi:hypothetical protein
MSFSDHYGPTTQELHDLFVDEIGSLGGFVSDCYENDSCLIMRGVLPVADDVVPGDTIRGGIAVRAVRAAIFVHPYTLRQVCTNGAVMAQATQSVRLERVEHDGIVVPGYEIDAVTAQFSAAIRRCAEPVAFIQSVDDMRSAMHTEVNMALGFLPMIARFPAHIAQSLVRHVFETWAGDRSVFGLMNAVTAFARETPDPETRWSLEELGGSLPARIRQPTVDLTPSMAF